MKIPLLVADFGRLLGMLRVSLGEKSPLHSSDEVVLPSVFYRSCFLLRRLDGCDHFLHRNPSVGGYGNQRSIFSGCAPVLRLGSTRNVPSL